MGIRKLRDRLTAAIRRAREGQTIEVTRDGRPVALLSPTPADRLERLERAGELTAAVPPDRPLRQFVPQTRTTEELISDDRGT